MREQSCAVGNFAIFRQNFAIFHQIFVIFHQNFAILCRNFAILHQIFTRFITFAPPLAVERRGAMGPPQRNVHPEGRRGEERRDERRGLRRADALLPCCVRCKKKNDASSKG